MGIRIEVVLGLALALAGCGEDSSSRYVDAPELGRSEKAKTSPGAVPGSANASAQDRGGGSGGGKEPDSGDGEQVVPAVPAGTDCAVLSKSALAGVSAVGGFTVSPGESVPLPFALPDIPGCPWSVTLEPDPAHPAARSGAIAANATFTAPPPEMAQSTVRAKVAVKNDGAPGTVARVGIVVVPADTPFVADDGMTRGALGNVYRLPDTTTALPDFGTMTPIARILAPNIDVPFRSYTVGVPGLDGLNEWFGIRFDFVLDLPTAGAYEFAIESDDGARLAIDGKEIVVNDGLHSPARKASGPIGTLTAGRHALRLDYFQGPRDSLQVQLLWRDGPGGTWQIVPRSAFHRPD